MPLRSATSASARPAAATAWPASRSKTAARVPGQRQRRRAVAGQHHLAAGHPLGQGLRRIGEHLAAGAVAQRLGVEFVGQRGEIGRSARDRRPAGWPDRQPDSGTDRTRRAPTAAVPARRSARRWRRAAGPRTARRRPPARHGAPPLPPRRPVRDPRVVAGDDEHVERPDPRRRLGRHHDRFTGGPAEGGRRAWCPRSRRHRGRPPRSGCAAAGRRQPIPAHPRRLRPRWRGPGRRPSPTARNSPSRSASSRPSVSSRSTVAWAALMCRPRWSPRSGRRPGGRSSSTSSAVRASTLSRSSGSVLEVRRLNQLPSPRSTVTPSRWSSRNDLAAKGFQHGLDACRRILDSEVDLAGGFVALVVGHQFATAAGPARRGRPARAARRACRSRHPRSRGSSSARSARRRRSRRCRPSAP